jgi:hypothetical protein
MSLEKKFYQYTKKNHILKLDYLADKWGCQMWSIVELICNNYSDFPNVVFDELAVHLNYPDTHKWWYEYGYGFTNEKDERQFKRHITGRADQVSERLEKWSGKPDRHMSVFMHDGKWKKNFNDRNAKVRCPFIYLELDRGGDLEKAVEDADRFLAQFPVHDGVQLWHSGNTSIHIGIPSILFGDPIGVNTKVCGRGKLYYNLARMAGGNIRFDNDYFDPHMNKVEECNLEYERIYGKTPPDDPQRVRQGLEHFDPNIFYMNSMIRMPGTIHEKTEKEKTTVDFPSLRPGGDPKPWLLHWSYLAWEPIRKPGRKVKQVDVRKYDSFVIQFLLEHIRDLDPDRMNSAGWVHSLPSPFYEDTNPDVSVCVDPESKKFGHYKDFGNEDDNCDFVGFVSRIIGKSRRSAIDYINAKS